MDEELAGRLLVAYSKRSPQLDRLAEQMFIFSTQHGLPPDMFLSKIDGQQLLDLDEKTYIVSEYLSKVLEHKRLSGIEEKNLNKVRRNNKNIMMKVIQGKEIGLF